VATTQQTLQIKTLEEIRDDYLRTYRNMLIAKGIDNPSTGEGSEVYLRATALAQQVYAASASAPVLANAMMPDTAEGDDLLRWARLRGIGPRPAGVSSGGVYLSATIDDPIAIPEGAQLIDGDGLTYRVVTGAAYRDGEIVPIESVETGDEVNLEAGVKLRWTAPPEFVQPTAEVIVGGLTGGTPVETEDGFRARLLDLMANPPNGVNSASFNLAAEKSSPAVQKAFFYPAANGPSTGRSAVVGAPTSTNKTRVVNALVMSTVVEPAVSGHAPEFVDVVTTTVEPLQVNVAVGLDLPAAKTAVPAGPGGGWVDAVPFPLTNSLGYSYVDLVTSSTEVRVTSDVAPVVGGSVCWLSGVDWRLRTAKVLSFVYVPGPVDAYTITLDTALVSSNGTPIAVNDWLFPASENVQAYVDTLLESFAGLGPGQITSVVGLLPRARRRPFVTESWPSDLDSRFLRPLATYDEVYSQGYNYKSLTTPPVPSLITDPPYIFTPGRLGFYPTV